VHSLTLGRRNSGERFWRKTEGWREWLGLADVVQMNAAEAALLGGFTPHDRGKLQNFALFLLNLGPQGVVLTMGEDGVMAANWSGKEKEVWHQAADTPERGGEPTGCGDVFLATMGWGYIGKWSFQESVRMANKVAGIMSRFQEMSGLEKIAECKML